MSEQLKKSSFLILRKLIEVYTFKIIIYWLSCLAKEQENDLKMRILARDLERISEDL